MSTARDIVQIIMDSDRSNQEKRRLLDEFRGIPNRSEESQFLMDLVESEKSNIRRAWGLSLLAAVNTPETINFIVDRLAKKKETYSFAKFWAIHGLAKSQITNLKDVLIDATNDRSSLVKAFAYRLLSELGEEGYLEKLLDTIKDRRDWMKRFYGCRVLRSQVEIRPLSKAAEDKILPVLIDRLLTEREVLDVRRQAALALGNMHHKKMEAIEALDKIMREIPHDWTRRSCVDSLSEINQPETRHALLYALRDEDAEIRVRAGKGLKKALDNKPALEFIIGEMLKEEVPDEYYLNALRRIDDAVAAAILTDLVKSRDHVVSQRANMALVRLGGEEAHRVLMRRREEALDKYTELLKEADKDIRNNFSQLMTRAHEAFSLSMTMHRVIFALGLVMLAGSFYVALSSGFGIFEKYVGVGGVTGSIVTLLALFYKQPLSNIQKSITALVDVNVIFLGYVRQINQIDATFKQLYLAVGGFSITQLKDTVQQIQCSVSKTMEEVKAHLRPPEAS